MNNYRQYFLPDGLVADRRKWTRKHAEIYFEWFIENKLDRINYFLSSFNECFEDFGENDVKRLSQRLYDRLIQEDCWFLDTVEVKIKIAQETRHVKVKALTELGRAIASDFGIVFSFILEKNIPGLNWIISKEDKRFISYKSPVLTGFRKGQSSVVYDPIHEGINRSSVMLNYNDPNEWPNFLKTIIVRWNRKTPSVAELLERQRQGKSTNIEDIQREMGWLE
jgi:hypothetical protein